MAKKFYVPDNGKSKEVKKFYVPVDGLSKKVVKAYCSVNGLSKLFFGDGGGSSEYNHYQRTTLFFQPNMAYNLNKLNLRTTIEIALDTCVYVSKHNPSVLAVAEKFKTNIENIWSYVSTRLTNQDTVEISIYFSNMGTPYIRMDFSNTDMSNVQIRTANTGSPWDSRYDASNPISLRYTLSRTVLPSSLQIEVDYDINNDSFSYHESSSSPFITSAGGYNLAFGAGTNPVGYQVLYYSANNIGSTQENSIITPNDDYFMKVNCMTGRVIEGSMSSGSNSNHYLVDDDYNYYGISYQKDTRYVEKTNEGLLIKQSYVTVPHQFLFKGIADYIFKFGDISEPYDTRYLIYSSFTYNNYTIHFGLLYVSSLSWQISEPGWYIQNYDINTDSYQYTLISTNKNIFKNALLQLHFENPVLKTLDIYVNGDKIKGSIPCSMLYDFVLPACYIGHYTSTYSFNITLEKFAISRSKVIVTLI